MTLDQPRGVLRCLSAAVLLALVLLLVSCSNVYVRAEEAAADPAAASVDTSVWISGPATVWALAKAFSAATISAMALMDMTAAVKQCDPQAAVTSDFTLTPYIFTFAGPATGMNMAFTVSTSSLSATDLRACVQKSPLRSINMALSQIALVNWMTTSVIPAPSPTVMTRLVDSAVPIIGSVNAWEKWMGLVAEANVAVQGAFLSELEKDLQSAVDAQMQDYLVVITGGSLLNAFVNASSLYVPYTIWKFPSSTAADVAASALTDRVFASLLPKFNAIFNTYFTTLLGEESTTYRSLFPALITAWRPVLDSSRSGSVWVSGPSAVWSLYQSWLKVTVAADLALAMAVCSPGSTFYISELAPYTLDDVRGSRSSSVTPFLSIPATGVQLVYTVSNTSASSAVLAMCAQQSPLTLLNYMLAQVAANYSLTVRPIPVGSPDTTTLVVDTLLPLAGSSYGWQVALTVLANMTADMQSVFLYLLQTDLQDAVDSTMSSYIAVVSTDLTRSFANASSFYLSYSVWEAASPTRTAVQTLGESDFAGTLRSRVMASQLPAFNKAFNTLVSSFDAISEYRAFFPSVITPREALVADVDAGGGGGSGSGDDVVLHDEVGEYLLVFAGDAATWGRVWAAQPGVVSAAVVSAAQPRLSRRTSHNTIAVVSATTVPNEKRYVGGLQVRCRVVQGVTRITENVWDPEQVVSLLRQVNYTAMEALYTAASRSAMAADAHREPDPGALATAGIVYDYSYAMQLNTIGIICMSGVIVVACVTMVLVAVGFVCCCPHMLRLCFPDDVEEDAWPQRASSESGDMSLRDLAASTTTMGKGKTWSASTTVEANSVTERGMRNPLERRSAPPGGKEASSRRSSVDVGSNSNSRSASRRSSVASARSGSRRESALSGSSGSPSMHRKVSTIPAHSVGRRESMMSQSLTKEKTTAVKRSASMSHSALSQHSTSSSRASARRRTSSVDVIVKSIPTVPPPLQQPQRSSPALPSSTTARRSVSRSPPITLKDSPTAVGHTSLAGKRTSVEEEVNVRMPKAVPKEAAAVVMAFTESETPRKPSEASVVAVQLPPCLTEKKPAATPTAASRSTTAATATATSPSTSINSTPLTATKTATAVNKPTTKAKDKNNNSNSSSSSSDEDSNCPSIVTATSPQCGAPATFRPTHTSPPPVLPKSDIDEFYMFPVEDEDGQTEAAHGRHVSVIPHIATSPIEAPMSPASSPPPAPTTSELITVAAPPQPVAAAPALEPTQSTPHMTSRTMPAAACPPAMPQTLLRNGSMGFSRTSSQMAPLMFNRHEFLQHQQQQQQQQYQYQQQMQQQLQSSFYSNPHRASCPANVYAPPPQQQAAPVTRFPQPTTSALISTEQGSFYQRSLAGANAPQDSSPPPSFTRRRSVSFTKNTL